MVQSLFRYEENVKWINEHYEELKGRFIEEWVAVMNGKVIDHDGDLSRFVTRLKETYGEVYDEAAIEYVSRKEIDLIL
ncbi:MAG: hypothetical protein ACE5Z5_10555 [Candidatus Bathyarchaeia archaeon]